MVLASNTLMSTKELTEGVEKRFEVSLTIAMFFAVLMLTYFDIVGGSPEEKKNAFIFSPLIGFYIGSYVCFQIVKLLPPLKLVLQTLNWLLLLGIASFCIPTLFTLVAKGPIPMSQFSLQVNTAAYVNSIWIIMILPSFLFYFLITSVLLGLFTLAFPKLASKKVW